MPMSLLEALFKQRFKWPFRMSSETAGAGGPGRAALHLQGVGTGGSGGSMVVITPAVDDHMERNDAL